MTVSPPQTNGHKRLDMPVFGDWRPVTPDPEPAKEQRTPEPQPEPAATPELVAQAQAEAIRAQAWADAEAQRIAAEAEADAVRVKAEEEARRLRLANDRQERKAREEEEAADARIAESRRKRDEANRAREQADRQAAEEQQSEAAAAQEIADADDKWRKYAIRFAVVCGIVSLPVQMSFFWNPHAPWMAAAPIMLEGAAWVVHRGARAAVASRRPVWHYRTIVWLLAFVAAGVNLYHGLHSFDPGTALATAFASIAGPGVWDLHEHGRIRRRDGALTRRERKVQRKNGRAEAARRAGEEKRITAEKEAANKVAEAARQELRKTRQAVFADVWDEAVKIGAALGKEPDDPAVWPRAYRNIKGCDPGESIESITARRTAEKRVEAALTGTPVSTLSKTTNAQRVPQLPQGSGRGSKTGPKVRGVRRSGDAPKYAQVARTQARLERTTTVEKTAQKDPS